MVYKASIRDKLMGIFVLIKVIPLIVLAWFAWHEISSLSLTLENHVNDMAKASTQTAKQVASLATSSSIRALDVRSREAIEHLTTNTARNVAAFLFDRDIDIRMVSLLPPDKVVYKDFLAAHTRNINLHNPWVLNEAGDAWEPGDIDTEDPLSVYAGNKENELDFHYRPPETEEIVTPLPLYLEITLLDLSGQEQIKLTTSDLVSGELLNVSKKDQTFCRAETYFDALKTLKPGEIYVSNVIGAYVKTRMIGSYTKTRAQEMGLAFEPE